MSFVHVIISELH